MKRFPAMALIGLLLSLVTGLGCGSSSPVASPQPPQANQEIPNDSGVRLASAEMPIVDATGSHGSATDVISHFLDAVRRGGEPADAQQWLTQKAQSELRRIGHKLEPIGSPSAKFTVTRAENIPETPGAALVHSFWEEIAEDGTPSRSQVVWAVQWERDSWRISGFAVQSNDQAGPVILDFENGDLMASYLIP